jgi:uncharacterized protein YndB with AHSA1/START domain
MSKNNLTTLIAEPGKKEAIIMRVYDAPRQLVWEAYTKPELLKQWWAPKRFITRIEKLDLKPGGTWRFINPGPDGKDYAFNGVFREVVPPERLVETWNFEAMPGHESVQTLKLEEKDGKTKVIATAAFQSVEDRDGMMKSGMEEATPEIMDSLGELLERMKKERKK